MLYYNPETEVTLDRNSVKRLLNTSFPVGAEEVKGWHLLHNGTAPETLAGQSIACDEIVFENGRYVQTYKVVGTAMPEEPSYEERLAAIEDGIAELAQIIAEAM